jgi:hypothetical protein
MKYRFVSLTIAYLLPQDFVDERHQDAIPCLRGRPLRVSQGSPISAVIPSSSPCHKAERQADKINSMADVGRASPTSIISEDKTASVDATPCDDSGIGMDVNLGPAPSGVVAALKEEHMLAGQSISNSGGKRTLKRDIVMVDTESDLTSLSESPPLSIIHHVGSAGVGSMMEHIT